MPPCYWVGCQNKAQYECGNCHQSYYCSKNCQDRDWQLQHQDMCLLRTSIIAAASATASKEDEDDDEEDNSRSKKKKPPAALTEFQQQLLRVLNNMEYQLRWTRAAVERLK